MITQKVFGKTANGEEVLAFTLSDGKGSAVILNLGGVIQSIKVPNRDGGLTDVVLGYSEVSGYESNGGYLGALIGRFGNRIEKGKLVVDGKLYQLYCNNDDNHLHGGKEGFNKKLWAHQIDGEKLVLTYVSPDGEENYPGTLNVKVVYTFLGGELTISYEATSDKNTVCNLTNHVYFNLNGEGTGSATDNVLQILSDEITPTDESMIPHGEFRAVAYTPFDFNTPKTIERDIEAEDEDLKKGGGYDHCFMLKNGGEFALYAVAESKKTGIKMSCYTDMPAVQFYAGNGLKQEGKSGYYGKRSGFCLETQQIPNNVNVPAYQERGSSYLPAGKVYAFKASYKFERV